MVFISVEQEKKRVERVGLPHEHSNAHFSPVVSIDESVIQESVLCKY